MTKKVSVSAVMMGAHRLVDTRSHSQYNIPKSWGNAGLIRIHYVAEVESKDSLYRGCCGRGSSREGCVAGDSMREHSQADSVEVWMHHTNHRDGGNCQ